MNTHQSPVNYYAIIFIIKSHRWNDEDTNEQVAPAADWTTHSTRNEKKKTKQKILLSRKYNFLFNRRCNWGTKIIKYYTEEPKKKWKKYVFLFLFFIFGFCFIFAVVVRNAIDDFECMENSLENLTRFMFMLDGWVKLSRRWATMLLLVIKFSHLQAEWCTRYSTASPDRITCQPNLSVS